jgi:hypothetical protein
MMARIVFFFLTVNEKYAVSLIVHYRLC